MVKSHRYARKMDAWTHGSQPNNHAEGVGCSGSGQECYPSRPLAEDLGHQYYNNIEAILGELVVESSASLALQRVQWSRRRCALSRLETSEKMLQAAFDLVLHDINPAVFPVDISSSVNFLVSNGAILLSVPASGAHVEDANVGALTLGALAEKLADIAKSSIF
ncbi:hypothetical protein BU15DRAFT_76824 [Melanogaster broomeanus]|nr:hypothetical protein BU15DRAFT_76824 [Melanogaster broomeanus]